MITKKNTLPVLAIIAIIGAVAVAVFSFKQMSSKQATGDSLTSIESDLNSTSLDGLDKETSDIQNLLK